MNKKNVLWTLLDLVFLIVFNTAFFVVGGAEHPASVWLSYGFIHFAYVMILITPILTKKGKSSAVFGFSIYAISSAYFIVEFVVGVVFILIGGDSVKLPLIVQIIIAGIYAILLITNLIANESTADSERRHDEAVSYIKTASLRVKSIMNKSDNKKINKEVEKVYDLLHSSPVKSVPEVYTLETEIINKIAELEQAVFCNEDDNIKRITRDITRDVEERNKVIKMKQS